MFPTPSPATVTAGDRETFVGLEEAIAPKEVVVDDWWAGDGGDGATAGGPPNVLDQVQLGPVEATTLEASDAQGLTDWLDENGYALRDEIAAGLGDYVERGWYFVALKLTSDVPLSGGLDPIRFTFDTDQLVYPMDLSRHATTTQQARLYIFQDHRARVAGLDDPEPVLQGEQTVWAGQAPGGFDDLGRYLTVVDLYFSSPATQIPGDLVVVQAGDDEPCNRPTRPRDRSPSSGAVRGGGDPGAASGIVVLIAIGSLIARAFRPERTGRA
ncbi:MAG: DUF2330 domain-containing protein [Schumannella sp.]